MTNEFNEPAKGGNLWLPEHGGKPSAKHRKPRWLRIALVWAMAFGFVALTVVYSWDYFNSLAVNSETTEAFGKAIAAGETSFTWQAGGINSGLGVLLLIPLFALSFTGFTTARKLLAGDPNKLLVNAWKVIAVLHFIMLFSLFPRLFVNDDSPDKFLESKGYSLAELASNSDELTDVIAITNKDGKGEIYRAEKTSSLESYTLKLPKELVAKINSDK